jgi:hypothetical protein
MSATSTSGPGKPGLDSPLFPINRNDNASYIDSQGKAHSPRMVTHVHGHLVQYGGYDSSIIPENTIPNTLLTPERVELLKLDAATNTDAFPVNVPSTDSNLRNQSSFPLHINVSSTGTNTEPVIIQSTTANSNPN